MGGGGGENVPKQFVLNEGKREGSLLERYLGFILFYFFIQRSDYVNQGGLEHTVVYLPQPPEYWC